MLRLVNVLLRSGTVLSKSLLIFFLAKFLNPHDMGLFGLLAGSISYALFIVGFEFYTYSTRELIGSDHTEWLVLIRDQTVFFLLNYCFILPFFLIIFVKGWLPWVYAGWFFVLLILEHAAQELNRMLVAMSEQLFASIILFFRSGAWCLFLVFVMWRNSSTRNLEYVFSAWFLGGVVACLLGIFRLSKYNKTALRRKIDWQWIRKGLKIAMPLLMASLAIRGIFTFDRYLVEAIAGLDVLGAYVLLIGIANAIVVFIDAGVIVFMYPQIIAAAKLGDCKTIRHAMKKLSWNIILITLTLVGVAFLLSKPLFIWIGKDIYLENLYLLKWILLSITIYSISMIPHIGLYANGHDKPILYSQVCGIIVFLLTVYQGKALYGVVIVPLALCLSFLTILIWKIVAYFSMGRKLNVVI